MFASHARLERVKIQLSVRRRIGRVTSKTLFEVFFLEFPSESFFQSLRLQMLVAHSQIESAARRVVAHQTLEEPPFPLENPGLHARSKGPENRASIVRVRLSHCTCSCRLESRWSRSMLLGGLSGFGIGS